MNLEYNKIFAAVLVAGIVAKLSGFIADKTMRPHEQTASAYHTEASAAVPAAIQKDTGPEPIKDLIASVDIERGQNLSKACTACHTFDKGGANRVGPNLWGVTARPKASVDGFAYSSAMKEKGGTWTVEDLNAFLYKPSKFLKGTKMVYAGMKKPEDRAALVKWLQSLK